MFHKLATVLIIYLELSVQSLRGFLVQ